MEKKYPVLKCNEELWAEIKPVLESFGVTDFSNIGDGSDKNDFQFDKYFYLVTNYGNYYFDKFLIGNINEPHIDEFNTLRYLVNTKEEFLSAVAKLLGKEYPIKEQSSEVKYPCIKCTQQLYDRIKDILEIVGYKEIHMGSLDTLEYLIINYQNKFGQLTNMDDIDTTINNRYLCSNIREFLTKACELKGFEISYVDFVGDGDAENHYFRYILDKDNNIITIHEIKEDKGECSATVTHKKKFKKKKENYVVSHNPAVGESSTVVSTIPAKGNDFDKDKGSNLDINKPMEKINIANKLRHCKKGTKFHHLMFGEVEFNNITDDNYICFVTTDKHGNKADYYVNIYATYDDDYPNGECLLFPSKDNRDWNDFQILEEGHRVMCSHLGDFWELRDYIKDNETNYDPDDNRMSNKWKYIVPVEDFDFTAEDITVNKEKSIV